MYTAVPKKGITNQAMRMFAILSHTHTHAHSHARTLTHTSTYQHKFYCPTLLRDNYKHTAKSK